MPSARISNPNAEEVSTINAIPVLNDNIIWVWSKGTQAVVVDPAVSEPVKNWLVSKDLTLIAVLQTHHHDDHIGGTKELLNYWPKAEVIASGADRERIPLQTISVKDGDQICLLGTNLLVIEVPGHTKFHIAYYLSFKNSKNQSPALFCGDTLFAAGCGRIFEGTAEEMYLSLNRLSKLPDETRIYCAHEYTESNLRWASSIKPENLVIQKRLKDIVELRKKGSLSLPSKIEEEKLTNLFLLAKNSREFGELRLNKDTWSS